MGRLDDCLVAHVDAEADPLEGGSHRLADSQAATEPPPSREQSQLPEGAPGPPRKGRRAHRARAARRSRRGSRRKPTPSSKKKRSCRTEAQVGERVRSVSRTSSLAALRTWRRADRVARPRPRRDSKQHPGRPSPSSPTATSSRLNAPWNVTGPSCQRSRSRSPGRATRQENRRRGIQTSRTKPQRGRGRRTGSGRASTAVATARGGRRTSSSRHEE